MWIVLKILIILGSILIYPPIKDAFWRPKEWVFLTLGFIFLASCWFNTTQYIFKNKWLSALFIWVVLCFGYYFLRPIAFAGENTVWNIWTLLPTFNVILTILLIRHLVEYTDNLNRWLDITKILCWMGVGFSIYAIAQFFGLDQIFPKGGKIEITHTEWIGKSSRMFTFFGNKMLSSNYIACITPLFLIFKQKKYYIGLGISLIALVLFRSTFNIGVALLGILVVLFLQGKWKICIGTLLVVMILFGIFIEKSDFKQSLPKFPSCSGRTELWITAIKKGSDKLFTGHGVGALERDYTNISLKPYRWHSSHNIIIDIFYDGGLIGLVLVIGYFCSLIKRSYYFFLESKSMLFIGLCGAMTSYFLMSMGSFPHKIAPLLLMGILYISAIEVHLSEKRRV